MTQQLLVVSTLESCHAGRTFLGGVCAGAVLMLLATGLVASWRAKPNYTLRKPR
jgi:hypothetical protein